MDTDTYFQLLQYLTDFTIPDHLNEQQRKTLIRKSKYFAAINGHLYKKNKKEPNRPLRVARRNEVDTILYNMHSDSLAGHFGLEETFRRIAIRYYWPQYYDDVWNYIRTCNECQRREATRRNEPLHPIKVR